MEGNTFLNMSGFLEVSTENENATGADNSYLGAGQNSAPFHISYGPVGRNDDGTFTSYYTLQMDGGVECDYLTIAMSGQGLINFWIVKDRDLDQVPIAGFRIEKIANPSGSFALGVRHKEAQVLLDVKTSWR
jgi:hypothetical protein